MLPAKATSVVYIMLISLSVIAALLFEYNGGDIVIGGSENATADKSLLEQMKKAAMHSAESAPQSYWNDRFWCKARYPHGWIICCEDVCGGVFSVYRFSFALTLFFGFFALLTAWTSKFAARAHRGFWIAKIFLLVGLMVSTLFIDNEVLVTYREISRYAAFLFLLLQILLIIDFAYTWNETWLSYDEDADDERCCGWKLAIIISAVLLYIGSITAWVLLYVYFGVSGCPAQQTVVSLTILFSLALTAVSCSKYAPHGTLLTSASVTAYATFLAYSALSSHPDEECNPLVHSGESTSGLLVGLILAAVSMASTAYNAAGSKQALVGKEQGADLDKPLDESLVKSDGEPDEVEAESWWYFHCMMVACSMYMAMLLTDWTAQPATENGVPVTGVAAAHWSVGLPSFWVKLVSQWVALGLYAWTLLAPYCLRESRDFGIEFDF